MGRVLDVSAWGSGLCWSFTIYCCIGAVRWYCTKLIVVAAGVYKLVFTVECSALSRWAEVWRPDMAIISCLVIFVVAPEDLCLLYVQQRLTAAKIWLGLWRP